MRRRDSRAIARAAKRSSDREARKTRAVTRGVVSMVNADGTAQVRLPSNAVIKVYPSNLYEFSENESITLLRYENGYQVAGDSGYGGGLGSPFAP